MTYEERLIRGKKSRKVPRMGDIFTMQIASGYLHGVVVSDGVQVFLGPDSPPCLLVHVDRRVATRPDEIPAFRCRELLMPPVITDRRGWTQGYFVTVGRLASPPVCPTSFFDYRWGGQWLDAQRNVLPGPVGDVAMMALSTYSAIGVLVETAIAGTQKWPPGSPRSGEHTPRAIDWSKIQRAPADPKSD